MRWQDGEGHSKHGGCDRVWLRSCVAAIALAAIALAAIVCGCDRDDKMETKMRGDGIFQFLLHI